MTIGVCGAAEGPSAARGVSATGPGRALRVTTARAAPLAKEPANTVLLDEGGAIPHSPFVTSISVTMGQPNSVTTQSSDPHNARMVLLH
jgi:hypothetical protein